MHGSEPTQSLVVGGLTTAGADGAQQCYIIRRSGAAAQRGDVRQQTEAQGNDDGTKAIYRWRKCATGQTIAEILGQSDRACVYTTKDNHLRWEFFGNRGHIPEVTAAVVGKFDSLMASIKLLALPAADKRELLLCLGKNLFTALNAKHPIPATAFEEVRLLLQARTGLQARFPRDVNNRNIFVVHGHDEAPREMVAKFLDGLQLVPLILQDQASAGLTIIEKFEGASDVSFAVVLLTPDDVGGSTTEPRS